MSTYAEQYPACTNCPKLIEWQISKNGMLRAFEISKINAALNNIYEEHETETARGEIDQRYADFLERVKEGLVSEEKATQAADLYKNLDDMLKRKAEAQSGLNDTEDSMIHFFSLLADNEVRMLARNCKGTKQISILGYKAVSCRSRMKYLSVNPAPPLDY